MTASHTPGPWEYRPDAYGSDALGERFRESCGLDVLGRIAAMLLDRDGFGDAYDPERIVEALEMSASHFKDGYIYPMLDGIAADLAAGFGAVDREEGSA